MKTFREGQEITFSSSVYNDGGDRIPVDQYELRIHKKGDTSATVYTLSGGQILSEDLVYMFKTSNMPPGDYVYEWHATGAIKAASQRGRFRVLPALK